jgi:tripartite-type tricarboxylate transporter receptor subunit TctC
MEDPEMREQLKKAGIEYAFYSPEECLSVVKKEVNLNEALLRKLKLIE